MSHIQIPSLLVSTLMRAIVKNNRTMVSYTACKYAYVEPNSTRRVVLNLF